MRHQRLYGRVATENLEEGAVPEAEPTIPVVPEGGEEVTTVVPIEAGADSLEADLVTVNDGLVEIQVDEAVVDEAAEVQEEMEVAVESLRIIAGNGGLCKGGAQILNQFHASWNRRLGLPTTTGTLSTESFGGTNSRAGQTQLAAESIAEKAKGIWQQIVELFKKALAAIGNIWKQIFSGAERLKARATKLAAAAGAIKGEPTAKTFENQKLAENLHIDGKVDAKAAAAAILNEAGVLGGLAERATHFANDATSFLTAGPSQPDGKTLIQKAKAIAQGDFQKVADPASVGVQATEGIELFKGKTLPGNKAVIALVPAGDDITNEHFAQAISKAGYKLGLGDASKKVGDKVQLNTLTTADVAAIAKEMVTVADKVIGYKVLQSHAEAAAKKLIAAAEKVSSETGKTNAAEGLKDDKANADTTGGKIVVGITGWVEGKIAQALARGAMSMVTNAAPPVAGYVLNAGMAVLQYGEQSLKQYGAKQEAPAAEPAPAAA